MSQLVRSRLPSSGVVWHNDGARESRHPEPADGPRWRSAGRSPEAAGKAATGCRNRFRNHSLNCFWSDFPAGKGNFREFYPPTSTDSSVSSPSPSIRPGEGQPSPAARSSRARRRNHSDGLRLSTHLDSSDSLALRRREPRWDLPSPSTTFPCRLPRSNRHEPECRSALRTRSARSRAARRLSAKEDFRPVRRSPAHDRKLSVRDDTSSERASDHISVAPTAGRRAGEAGRILQSPISRPP